MIFSWLLRTFLFQVQSSGRTADHFVLYLQEPTAHFETVAFRIVIPVGLNLLQIPFLFEVFPKWPLQLPIFRSPFDLLNPKINPSRHLIFLRQCPPMFLSKIPAFSKVRRRRLRQWLFLALRQRIRLMPFPPWFCQ